MEHREQSCSLDLEVTQTRAAEVTLKTCMTQGVLFVPVPQLRMCHSAFAACRHQTNDFQDRQRQLHHCPAENNRGSRATTAAKTRSLQVLEAFNVS